MNAERLLALHDRVAEAPDAIPRLKRFVLDLAVRGKLVPQDPNDEPASELLPRIESARKYSIQLGVSKSRRAYTKKIDNVSSFPSGWISLPGVEIFATRSGNSKLIKGRLYTDPAYGRYPGFSASGQDVWLDTWEHEGAAIILSAVGARCGKAFLASGKWTAIANTHIIWPHVEAVVLKFALILLNNEDFWVKAGGAQPFVKVAETLSRPIGLPPLAEQKRIVAKVEELMALLDGLETARKAREATRDRLTAASLARLTEPETRPAEAAAHARFALDALPALTARPEQVKALRRTIFNLAVRGRLVPQDPNDEPASELLKRIAAEKARLVKSGEIGRKATSNPKMAEPPHEIPTSWCWAPLGTVFLYDAGTKREPGSLDPLSWLLELEDIEKETGHLLARLTVADREPQSTKSEFRAGDILYGKLRPYLAKVLVADSPGYSTTEIVAIRAFLPLCSEYCALALRRPDFVNYVTRLGQGTKMPRLRTEDAIVSPFPLPPLAEQKRIVAKVEELMALCDQLEAALAAASTTRARLLASLLHEALAAASPAALQAAE